MKTENILELADFLETLPNPEKFDMRKYTHNHACHTPSCFAGWGAWLHLGRPKGDMYDACRELKGLSLLQVAREFFGALLASIDGTYDWFDDLTVPTRYEDPEDIDNNNPWLITNEQGAKILRHLAETGLVDYSVAFPATDSVEEQAND